MSTVAERQRRLARERGKRWRARQHPSRRESVVPLVVTEDIVAFVAATGWLDEAKSEDRNEVAAAITAMLRDAARNS